MMMMKNTPNNSFDDDQEMERRHECTFVDHYTDHRVESAIPPPNIQSSYKYLDYSQPSRQPTLNTIEYNDYVEYDFTDDEYSINDVYTIRSSSSSRKSSLDLKTSSNQFMNYQTGAVLYYEGGMLDSSIDRSLITSIIFGDRCTSIAGGQSYDLGGAFHHCLALQHVTIPHRVQVGDVAFLNCTGLIQVIFEQPSTSSKLSLGAFAFAGCTSLVSMILPPVKSIPFSFMVGCSKITLITLPNTVENISRNAFSGNTSLTTVNLSKNLKEISFYSFSDCDKLKIKVPNECKIERYAFSGCTRLLKEANEGYQGNVEIYIKKNRMLADFKINLILSYNHHDRLKVQKHHKKKKNVGWESEGEVDTSCILMGLYESVASDDVRRHVLEFLNASWVF